MLNAILTGKSGTTIAQDITKGTSWRTLFKKSEDLLTATVFERLAYLPSRRFFQIISDTFGLSFEFIAGNTETIILKTIEFWPRWDDVTDNALIVEPDVFLSFYIPETGKTIDMIIEAKPFDTGTLQYKTQWERQILSYAAMAKELESPVIRVVYLALGGLGLDPKIRFSTLKNEFINTCDDVLYPKNLDFAGCSWSALMDTCENLNDLTEFVTRIVADILEALSLSGYSKRLYFNDLILELSHQELDFALEQNNNW